MSIHLVCECGRRLQVDESKAVGVPLEPGEISLHHIKLVH